MSGPKRPPDGLKKTVSRRGLLLGMVNRMRGPEEDGKTLDTFGVEEREADQAAARGGLDEAVRGYRDLLTKQAESHTIRAKMARCLYLQGKYLQARVECTRVLRRSDSRLATLYLGLCHAREGGLDRAVATWKNYFNPKAPELMRELNVIAARLEAGSPPDPQEAALDVERVLGIEP